MAPTKVFDFVRQSRLVGGRSRRNLWPSFSAHSANDVCDFLWPRFSFLLSPPLTDLRFANAFNGGGGVRFVSCGGCNDWKEKRPSVIGGFHGVENVRAMKAKKTHTHKFFFLFGEVEERERIFSAHTHTHTVTR